MIMQEHIIAMKITNFINDRTMKKKLTKADLEQLLEDVKRYAWKLDEEILFPLQEEAEARAAYKPVEKKKPGRPRKNNIPGAVIRKDKKEGMSLRELSKKYNLAINTIRAILSEDDSDDAAFFEFMSMFQNN